MASMIPILTAALMFLAGLVAGYAVRSQRVDPTSLTYRQSVASMSVFGHARRAF